MAHFTALRFSQLLESLLTAETVVGISICDHRVGVFHVQVKSLALEVRSVLSTLRPFIALNPNPLQIFENSLSRAFYFSGLVGVLDPQNKSTFSTLGVEVVENGCPEPTQVQFPSGRWSIPDPDDVHCQLFLVDDDR